MKGLYVIKLNDVKNNEVRILFERMLQTRFFEVIE